MGLFTPLISRSNKNVIHIDFETRSEINIKKCGAAVYAAHPTTEIMCVALAEGDNAVEGFISIYDSRLLEILLKAFKNNTVFIAHNAFFEYHIFNGILAKKLNLPRLRKEQWRCSAAQAAFNGLPRALGSAAKAINLDVEKDEPGRKLMMRMSKLRRPTKKDKSKWHESPELFERLLEYCGRDVEAERALGKSISEISDAEHAVWLLDFKINNKGVHIDTDAVEAALHLIAEIEDASLAEVITLTDGLLDGVSKRAKVIMWCNSRGVQLETYTAGYLRSVLSQEGLPNDVRRVLEIRLELGKTSTSKIAAFKAMAGGDDRARGLLRYYGAHTGRWAGKGIQPQNLPRGVGDDMDDTIALLKKRDFELLKSSRENPMDSISGAIRGMICAPEGKILIGADYSAIETRVLMYIADDKNALKLFEENKDLYKDMASTIYKVEADAIDGYQRQLGKEAILGLGFGMGSDRFFNTCETQNIAISKALAVDTVEKYREKYITVVRLWRALERAAIRAIKSREHTTTHGIAFYMSQCGRFLKCQLPSGRCINYANPGLGISTYGSEQMTYKGVSEKTAQWVENSTWGGKLTENIVQAIARDVMAEAMLRIDAAGYSIILTVHDEIILEENDGFDPQDLINLMVIRPEWVPNLPLAAEGWESYRYAKL